MKITSCAVMAGATLALVGCTGHDFNTPTLLNHIRILAVQAEPPQPSTGQATTVRALVYQPPASTDPDMQEVISGYHWRWCPMGTSPQDPRNCLVNNQDMADALFMGVPGVPKLDLGSHETATFTNPFPATMLASLCQKDFSVLPALAAAAAEKNGLSESGALNFGCTIAGFPITIQLVVDTTINGQPYQQYPAIFKVYLPVNDAVPPNQNPVVGAVNLAEAGVNYPIDEAGTWSAVRGKEAPLLLDLPLSSSETLPDRSAVFQPPDPNAPTREQLNIFWFAEAGDFGANFQGGKKTWYLGGDPNDPVTPFSRAVENTWNAPKTDKYDGATARIIVLVLDSRNGVSWTTGVLRLVDTPENRDGGMDDGPPDAGPPLDAPMLEDADAGDSDDASAEALP